MNANIYATSIMRLRDISGRVTELVLVLGKVALSLMVLAIVVDVSLRYAFNAPLFGTLDISTLLMVVVIASGVAYTAHLKRHVTVDILVDQLSPRHRVVIDTVVGIVSAVFLALIVWRNILHAQSLWTQTAVSEQLRVSLLPFEVFLIIGFLFLLFVVLIDLMENLAKAIEDNNLGVWIGIIAGTSMSVLLILTIVFHWLPFSVAPLITGIIGFVFLVILLLLGMPVGYALALTGFIGVSHVLGIDPGLSTLSIIPFQAAKNFVFLAIPLFILMGEICYAAGLSTDAYYAVYRLMGKLPGGLALATVGGCAGFAAVSGTTAATAATMGTVALPEMKKYGYDHGLAAGTVATGGTLGIMIPPSITFIVYALITEQSIGRLFLAGIIPGAIISGLIMLYIYIRARISPHMAPPGPQSTTKEKLAALRNAWGILVLFLVVIGGIYGGVFTPYEAGAVGAFGALLIGMWLKRLTWKLINTALINTLVTTSLMLIMLIGAAIFSPFVAVSRLPMDIAAFIGTADVAPWVVLVMIISSYSILGCFIPNIPLLLLTIPVFFPIVMGLGYDPIWFGVIVVVLGEIAIITPPVGINLYIVKGVAEYIPLSTIFKGIMPFIMVLLFSVSLLVAFPELSTFLPELVKGL